MSKECDAGCVYRRGHPGPCTVDALAALYDPKRYEHIKPDVAGRGAKYVELFEPTAPTPSAPCDVVREAVFAAGVGPMPVVSPRPAPPSDPALDPVWADGTSMTSTEREMTRSLRWGQTGMGGTPPHPAVGVATVNGRATCPQCPESVKSRATYARVPEHAAPAAGMTVTKVDVEAKEVWVSTVPVTLTEPASCACASLRDQGVGAFCSRCPPSPAEAAIFERGGYVPGSIGEAEARGHDAMRHGAKCCSNRGHSHAIWCPHHNAPCAECGATPTPAAMLGEAEGLAERIAILCGQVVVAEANAGHSLTDVYAHAADVGGLSRQIARSLRAAQREAEAREGRGGPAVDEAREDA